MGKATHYIWGLVGQFVPQALSLLVNMIFARFVSPEDFGVLAALAFVYMIASAIVESGMGGGLINATHLDDLDCQTIYTFSFSLSILMYIVITVASPSFERFLEIENCGKVLRVLSTIFIINTFGLVSQSLMARELLFKQLTIINICSFLISGIIGVVLAVLDFGVYALVFFQVSQAIVRVIGFNIVKPFRFALKFNINSFKRVAPFGLFSTLIIIIDTAYENLLTFLYGKFLPLQQTGYLGQSKRIEETASRSIVVTVNNVAFPILSKIKDSIHDFSKEANKLIQITCRGIFPILLTISLFSDEVILVLFGKDWMGASPYLKYLIFAGLFMVIESTYRNFIKSLGRLKELTTITIIKRFLAIAIILVALFIDVRFIIWAYIVGACIGYLLNAFLYCRIIHDKLFSHLLYLVNILAPLALYYFVVSISHHYFGFLISFVVALSFLAAYYLVFLPKKNINFLSYLKQIKA